MSRSSPNTVHLIPSLTLFTSNHGHSPFYSHLSSLSARTINIIYTPIPSFHTHLIALNTGLPVPRDLLRYTVYFQVHLGTTIGVLVPLNSSHSSSGFLNCLLSKFTFSLALSKIFFWINTFFHLSSLLKKIYIILTPTLIALKGLVSLWMAVSSHSFPQTPIQYPAPYLSPYPSSR